MAIDATTTNIYENCCCPLSLELMKQPVIDTCGHTFELAEIERLFASAKEKGMQALCPLSRDPIHQDKLTPNLAIKATIEQLSQVKFDLKDQMMIGMMSQISKQNRAVMQQNMNLQRDVQALKFENQLLHVKNKQLKNSADMDIWTRFCVFTGHTTMEEVENANLSDQEFQILDRAENRNIGLHFPEIDLEVNLESASVHVEASPTDSPKSKDNLVSSLAKSFKEDKNGGKGIKFLQLPDDSKYNKAST